MGMKSNLLVTLYVERYDSEEMCINQVIDTCEFPDCRCSQINNINCQVENNYHPSSEQND